MKRLAIVGVLLLLPLLAACGGGDNEDATPTMTKDQARVQLCADLSVFKNDANAVANASSSNTIGTLRRLVTAVQTSFANVKTSAEVYDPALATKLETSQQNLQDAMNNVPDTATVDEAKADISTQTAALISDLTTAEQSLECGLTSSATATTAGSATAGATGSAPAGETPTVAQSPSAEATATPAPTEAPTETPVPEATATPEPSHTPEPSPTPEPTHAPEPTATLEPTAAVEPTAVPGPPPTEGSLAYQADWSAGAGDWQLPEGWTIDNGALVTNSAVPHPVAAPYQPTTPNYAVEATIAVTGGNLTCDQTAGVFARAVQVVPEGQNGFPVAMLGSFCPERWEVSIVADATGARTIAAQGPFAPGTAEHTYRLEVSGSDYRLYIDGVFAGQGSDNRFGEPGKAGLYVPGGVQVRVTSFKVFEF